MKAIDIALKDFKRSLRSMFAVGMMLVAPLLITGLIYFAFGGVSQGSADLPDIAAGYVDLDVPAQDAPIDAGGMIVETLTDPSVASWLTARSFADENAARHAVDTQEIGVAVIVPAGFTAAVLAGEAPEPVRVIEDPTLEIGPRVVGEMVQGLLDGITGASVALETVKSRFQASGVTLPPATRAGLIGQYQSWYKAYQQAIFHDPAHAAIVSTSPATGAQGGGTGIAQVIGLIMAGQMTFFAFYTGAYSMISILKEDEEGTLARLFTTPTGRTLILFGKLLAVVLTVFVQGLVLMLIGRLLFDIHWGLPVSVVLALVAQVLAASGLGVLLISLIRSSKQAGPILGAGLTMLGMLGGLFTVGAGTMPAAFNTLSRLTPQGWVLEAWKRAMSDLPADELLIPLIVSSALGILMFAAGAAAFRRRFA